MSSSSSQNPLIIALDVDTTSRALELVERIGPAATFYKVGMELYAAAGMNFVARLADFGKKVFLDLKLFDISETVKRATREICKNEAVEFLTIYSSSSIMRAAVEGRGAADTKLLAVTVLTSFNQEDLTDLGIDRPVSEVVDMRVRHALESGVDGVICSPLDAARVRKLAGPKLKIVTPGVRSAGQAVGDQKRVATPGEAMAAGADHLVIGREVTRADDPRQACERILAEIEAARAIPIS